MSEVDILKVLHTLLHEFILFNRDMHQNGSISFFFNTNWPLSLSSSVPTISRFFVISKLWDNPFKSPGGCDARRHRSTPRGSKPGGQSWNSGLHPWLHRPPAHHHVDLRPQLRPLCQHPCRRNHQLAKLGQIQVHKCFKYQLHALSMFSLQPNVLRATDLVPQGQLPAAPRWGRGGGGRRQESHRHHARPAESYHWCRCRPHIAIGHQSCTLL